MATHVDTGSGGTKAERDFIKQYDPIGVFGIGTSGGGVASWATQQVKGGNELLGIYPTGGADYLGRRNAGVPFTATGADPTAAQLMATFAKMKGSALANVQFQLWQAGFYGSEKPNIGTFDPSKDIGAFKNMLIGHLATGQSSPITSYLSDAVTHWQATGAGRTPLVVHLADPVALKMTLQKTAQELYGGYLSDAQVSDFITSFQGLQTQQQTNAYKQSGYNPETGQGGVPGTTGSTEFSPDMPARAADYVRTNFPNQVAATEFGSAMNQMLDNLRRPG